MSTERATSRSDVSQLTGVDAADLQQAIDIYENDLAAQLEPLHSGETVAIHVRTGDFEVGRNSPTALRSIRTRHPEGPVITMGIGYDRPNPAIDRILAGSSHRRRL